MEDYAVVIGIRNYPGLGEPQLEGPENDAEDFEQWLLNPNGGKLRPENVFKIISSDYPLPRRIRDPRLLARRTKPWRQEVKDTFEKLRDISTHNADRLHIGRQVGRRLYIFMSGHGIAPNSFANNSEKDTALLMANVNDNNTGENDSYVPGIDTANWFCNNGLFEEVFLFMDCCRDNLTVQALNSLFIPQNHNENAIRFYASATKAGRKARERPMPDEGGRVRGIFTKTLLLGLSGGAAKQNPANPSDGIITVSSLSSFLINNMKRFIDPEFLQDPKIQEPDIIYSPSIHEGQDVIIKTIKNFAASLPKFPVKIQVPVGASGRITIKYNGIERVSVIPVGSPPEEISIDLPRGKYQAMVAINGSAESVMFDVQGVEMLGSEAFVTFNS